MSFSIKITHLKTWEIAPSHWKEWDALLKEASLLDQRFFPRPWAMADWEKTALRRQKYILTFLSGNGRLLGLCLILYSAEENLGHLLKILVHPDFREKKWGQKLWEDAITCLKKIGGDRLYLEVSVYNDNALRFYRKAGCRDLHKIKHFYGPGKDAISFLLVF